MIATKTDFREQRVSVFLILSGMLLPKCIGCLHLYAWATALALGTRGERCGDLGPSSAILLLEAITLLAILTVSIECLRAYGPRNLTNP